MNLKLCSIGLIMVCVFAGDWWLQRSTPALLPANLPTRVQLTNDKLQVNAEQDKSVGPVRPIKPIDNDQFIEINVAPDAPDQPEMKLHLAVHDMLQTLKDEGYVAFAEKCLSGPFLGNDPNITYHQGDEHLDPSFKAQGFGDLNQLIFELESMQNMVPRYNHNTTTVISPKNGVYSFRLPPEAYYDLPLNPGGPKEFFLQYLNDKWVIVPQLGNTKVW